MFQRVAISWQQRREILGFAEKKRRSGLLPTCACVCVCVCAPRTATTVSHGGIEERRLTPHSGVCYTGICHVASAGVKNNKKCFK